MGKEYDSSKSRKNPYAKQLKRQVAIRLDTSAVEYVKKMGAELGMPYQNLINLFLRELCHAETASNRSMAGAFGEGVRQIGRASAEEIYCEWKAAMAVENLAEVIRSLSPEEQESVQQFVEFLKRKGQSPRSPFLSAVDEFIDEHPELLRRLAQ